MPEIIERLDLVIGTIISVIELVTELVDRIEKDQIEPVFVTHGLNNIEQVFVFLLLAALVATPIDHPGNLCRRPVLLPKLFDLDAACPNEIHPPVVMGLQLVFFPLHQRDRTG